MAGDAELVNESRQLRKAVGAVGFFSLAFGCIVGSGWVIVLGDWLGRGGPGGAIVGFLAGGAALVLVGFCYAELAARMPRAGGEFLYACEGLGRDAGFFVAWFLTLYMIAVAAFEGIALSVMLRQLFDALRGVSGYELLGQRVTYVGVGVGLIGAAGICILNVLGARIAVGFQSIVTFTFIGILLMVVTIAFVNGSPRNWAPVFPNTSEVSWWQGALWVFSISGMFLNGFQAGLYAIEERREKTSLRRSVLSVVAAIAAAAAFYSLLVLASTSAVPWPQLVRADLPAATAFAASVPGGILGTVVIVAAAISLTKTWNAVALMASRLIFAQARLGYLPILFARVSRRSGAPSLAIITVTILTMTVIPLGRGAVVPIVNMCSICLALSYVLCLAILLRLRRRAQQPAERPQYEVPGGSRTIWIGLAASLVMAAIAVAGPAFKAHTVPLEWKLIIVWAVAGAPLWILMRRSNGPIAHRSQGI
jgi:amino acid transporter